MNAVEAITWLGSAGLRVDLVDGQRIYIDPWLGGSAFPASEREIDRIDAILVTHAHVDHASDAPKLSADHDAPLFAQTEVSQWLVEQGGIAGPAMGMNMGGSIEICGINVTMVPAVHTSSADGLAVGSAAGFVLEWADESLYVAGDTDVFGDMALIAEIYRPNLAVLPVGGLMTMGPRQVSVALRLLGYPHLLPYHWGSPLLPGTPALVKNALGAKYAGLVIDALPGTRLPWAAVTLPGGE